MFSMKNFNILLISLFIFGCGTDPIYLTNEYIPVVGPTGPKGDKGDKGDSCTVMQAENGAIILCQDGTSVLVLNGKDGEKGEQGDKGDRGDNGENGVTPGVSPYNIVAIIDPCGPDSNHFDEILIRLANNTLIAFFEDGGKRFLASLPPGNYETTDRQKCRFTVNADMTVTF